MHSSVESVDRPVQPGHAVSGPGVCLLHLLLCYGPLYTHPSRHSFLRNQCSTGLHHTNHKKGPKKQEQKFQCWHPPLRVIKPLVSIDGNACAQGFGEYEDIPHQGRVGQYVLFWPTDLRVRSRERVLKPQEQNLSGWGSMNPYK